MKKKTIAVLTSGGDAPGMNAAVRAVVRCGLNKKMRVLGVRHGYQGLLDKEIFEMKKQDVSGCIARGGTILSSSRCKRFNSAQGVQAAKFVCKELEISGLVVIGGDGSFRGARDLSMAGIPCIGIPGTIDNDIASTDFTVGFDTAINTVANMVEKIKDTAASHDCCTVVEVMGRHCGDIALHAGVACGAIAILVPEMPFSVDDIVSRIKEGQNCGKQHFIVMLAEGTIKDGKLHSANALADELGKRTGIKTRTTDLGFVQRGGNPTVRERILATEMGFYAVELLEKGMGNRVIAVRESKLIDIEIQEALLQKREFNKRLYEIAYCIAL